MGHRLGETGAKASHGRLCGGMAVIPGGEKALVLANGRGDRGLGGERGDGSAAEENSEALTDEAGAAQRTPSGDGCDDLRTNSHHVHLESRWRRDPAGVRV